MFLFYFITCLLIQQVFVRHKVLGPMLNIGYRQTPSLPSWSLDSTEDDRDELEVAYLPN